MKCKLHLFSRRLRLLSISLMASGALLALSCFFLALSDGSSRGNSIASTCYQNESKTMNCESQTQKFGAANATEKNN